MQLPTMHHHSPSWLRLLTRGDRTTDFALGLAIGLAALVVGGLAVRARQRSGGMPTGHPLALLLSDVVLVVFSPVLTRHQVDDDAQALSSTQVPGYLGGLLVGAGITLAVGSMFVLVHRGRAGRRR